MFFAFNRSNVAPALFAPLVIAAAVVAATAWPTRAFASTQPRLGTALNFAVLAGSTITNTGPTVIKGNLGLSPGSAVTGFPPGTSGVQSVANAAAVKAKNDLVTAFTDAASSPTTSSLTGRNLGGMNLTAGTYTFSSSAQLTGKLTLTGSGVFIFRIGSSLTTASSSSVVLRSGAAACAVYWEIGSSATLGSATQFQGNLMALTSITMVTGANILPGRALARNGAVSLDTNQITPPSGPCTTANTTATPRGVTPTPPHTGAGVFGNEFPVGGLALIVVGGSALVIGRRRA